MGKLRSVAEAEELRRAEEGGRDGGSEVADLRVEAEGEEEANKIEIFEEMERDRERRETEGDVKCYGSCSSLLGVWERKTLMGGCPVQALVGLVERTCQ